MSNLKEFVKELVRAIVIALLIMQVVKPTIVKESSMEPTLYENNYLLLARQIYRFEKPQRGDIIVFHSDLVTAGGKEKLLIKRIIGLPGDVITIANGNVYLNGNKLTETYIKDGTTDGEIIDFEVPEGELFVMGDNRLVSVDSRSAAVGTVKLDRVLGKAFVRLYPFNEIRLF